MKSFIVALFFMVSVEVYAQHLPAMLMNISRSMCSTVQAEKVEKPYPTIDSLRVFLKKTGLDSLSIPQKILLADSLHETHITLLLADQNFAVSGFFMINDIVFDIFCLDTPTERYLVLERLDHGNWFSVRDHDGINFILEELYKKLKR